MTNHNHFEHLFVFGRPAAGKSEFIDCMKKCEATKRLEKFHIAPFDILDDYLFLRELADNENILEKLSIPRRLTKITGDGIVAVDGLFFDFAAGKLNLIFTQKYIPNPEFYNAKTLLLEFSRGTGRDGYKKSLTSLKSELLKRSAILYVKASYEESIRRNEARYREKLKYSILAHKCPEEAMERFYRQDDWDEITDRRPSGLLNINGINIPFVTMDNEPESNDSMVMETRYAEALTKVFNLRQDQ